MSTYKETIARETIAVAGRERAGSSRRRAFVGLFALMAMTTLFSPQAGAQVANAVVPKTGSQTPAKVLDGTAVFVKHYDPAQKLRLAIVLTPPHLAEERQFLEDVQNKNSPLFHRFLTDDEWNARFAPTAADEQAVVDWAQTHGLTVTQRFPNRLAVDVEAPAGTIETAFGVVINNYQVGPDLLYSNDRDPILPNPAIHSVLGLNSINHDLPAGGTGRYVQRPDYAAGPTVQTGETAQQDATSGATPGTSSLSVPGVTPPPAGYFTPADMFSSYAYDYGALMNQGHCCNPLGNPGSSPPESSIAIAAYGDVSLTDVGNFQGYFNYLAINVQKYYIDGTYVCGSNDDNCSETTLDTEWSLAMANSQGAAANTAKVYVYEGFNTNQQTVFDLLGFMLKDGYARVMSTSWSGPEGDTTYMDDVDYIYSEMVGKGWTLLGDSGDQGATGACNDGLSVRFPSSDPNAIGVGGTELNQTGGSSYEVGWTGGTTPGSCSSNGGGSTGGFSSYWSTPSYQSALGFGSRAVPDLALDAYYGHDTYFNGGWIHPGGTSVSTPMMAGFFAQDNAYLLSIGNKCGSSGTSPCAPLGNANYPVYDEGIYNRAGRNPFYDTIQGCNSNDITLKYGLTPYCAKPGFDEVTGWGSANMLQLSWAINWEVTAANGYPYITFTGPATGKWYNTNQTVNWKVVDYTGGTGPGTGIAGETQGWDSIPSDPGSEPHGGSGNSFYSGPQFVNSSTGCLAFQANGCAGGAGEGCHTVDVEAWNNQGLSTGVATYGPLCQDTTPPTVTYSLSPAPNSAGWNDTAVTVTFDATDPGGANASGIKATYYSFGTGCSTTSLGSCQAYSSPFVVSTQGQYKGVYFTEDNAGNFSSVNKFSISIDETAPVTIATPTGTFNNGVYNSAVTITLKATDNLSGVASTTYFVNNGTRTPYTGPVAITSTGLTTVSYFSTDVAGNVELTGSYTFTIVSPTTTAVTSLLNPSVYGQPVTFTATVTGLVGALPTGTVSFLDGTTSLGTGTLSGGTATLTISSLLNGTHSITAAYPGSSLDLSSKSAALTETVKDSTATTLTSSLNPSSFGQAVALTAAVTATHGGAVGGTVTFMDGTTTLGTGTLDTGGKATYSTSTFAPGLHSLTAVYGGSATDGGSTSATLGQTVALGTSTTAVSSSMGTSVYGQSVTFTATVVYTGGGTVSGSVDFFDGTTLLGTGTVSAGKVSLSVATLAAGSHSITAVYAGNTDYAASTSAAISQTVDKASTTTALSSSLNPSDYGQAVTLTATITLAHGGSAGGTVSFMDGATNLGTGTVDTTNMATLTLTTLSAGSRSLTAVFNGSSNDTGSTSPVLIQIVKGPTATTLTSSLNPSVFGQAVTLTATVTAPLGGTPTGTVSFMSGFTSGPATLGTGTLNGAGQATITTTTLCACYYEIYAQYAGNASFTGSTSANFSQEVKDTSTTTLTSSPNPSTYGQTVTLTASIVPTHGGPVGGAGTVTFMDGTTSLGTAPVPITGNPDQAAISLTTLATGSHSLTAVFSGSNDAAGSTSAILTQVVKGPTTTALASSLNPSVFGQSVTLTATVTATLGGSVSGNVTFMDGTTALGPGVTLDSAGKATFTSSSLSAGSHVITATYSGSGTLAASTSLILIQTVKDTTTTKLTSSLNPSDSGQTVTLTAAVIPTHGGLASGSVTFMDGTTTLGTAGLSALGDATFSTNALAAGSHSLTAVYGGSATDDGSTSATLTQTVK